MVVSGSLSSSLSFLPSLVPLALTLDRGNFVFWHSQILPVVRAHDLEGFLLGNRPCLAQFITLQSGKGNSSSNSTNSVPVTRLNLEYSY